MIEQKLRRARPRALRAHWGDIATPVVAKRGGPLSRADAHTLVQGVLSRQFDVLEDTMRITIKLDQPADPDAFAVLWLDLESRHWSREMHSGVDIPSWGLMRTAPDATLICDPDSPHSHCALTGLDLEDRTRLIAGQSGQVLWYCDSNLGARPDRWRVQCIESKSTEAENEVFDE